MSHDNNYNYNYNNHSFKDSFTSDSPFLSNNLPNKFAAKHLKLLSFLKWFYDNNLNLPDFYDTHASLNFLHRFLDFESQFTKRFKSFLKLKIYYTPPPPPPTPTPNPTTPTPTPTTNTNTNTNTIPLYQHTNDNESNEYIKSNEEIITFNEKKTNQKKTNVPVPENSSDFVKMIIESSIEE